MSNCISCGTPLYALNMGFVDDGFCQKCEAIKMEILSRDIEQDDANIHQVQKNRNRLMAIRNNEEKINHDAR